MAPMMARSSPRGGQNQHSGLRMLGANLSTQVNPRVVRQHDVRDHQIGLQLAYLLQGLSRRLGLPNHLHVGAASHDQGQATPYY